MWSKSIKKFKREISEMDDLYNIPDDVKQMVEHKKQRVKNDFLNYANPENLAKLKQANFWNSVFLMQEKKKDKGKSREFIDLKDVT